MRIYADHPDRRIRQVLGDVIGVTACLAALPAGRALHGWLMSYAEPGRELETAAGALADNLHGAADTVGGIPLVGESVAEPLTNAGDSAAAMAEAGRSLQDFVGATSVLAGVLLTLAALVAAGVFWVAPRVRWVQQADAARAVRADPDGLDVLALRALASAPVAQLDSAGAGLLAAWREGDADVIRRLAGVEMSRLGLYLSTERDVR